MRKPRGFQRARVPFGLLVYKEEEGGRWVLLAGEPEIKIDNKHRDGRPHMHAHGRDSKERRDLREDPSLAEAVEVVARQLNEKGHIDVTGPTEELS